LKQARLREPRRSWVEAALTRLSQMRLETAQAMLAAIDRQSKGLDPVGDAWDTMLRMGLVMAGPARKTHGR
jgi:DNA polymerase-3 subunit delta